MFDLYVHMSTISVMFAYKITLPEEDATLTKYWNVSLFRRSSMLNLLILSVRPSCGGGVCYYILGVRGAQPWPQHWILICFLVEWNYSSNGLPGYGSLQHESYGQWLPFEFAFWEGTHWETKGDGVWSLELGLSGCKLLWACEPRKGLLYPTTATLMSSLDSLSLISWTLRCLGTLRK